MSVFYVTTRAAGDSLPNGTRIEKAIERPDDAHPVGAGGVVLGSMNVPADLLEEQGIEALPGDEFFYFVEWDDMPGLPVGVRGSAIRRA